MTGFVKRAYSDEAPEAVGAAMTLVEDCSSKIAQSASTIFGVHYSELKPPRGHIGVHSIALGDYERYGLNRNYDGFPKAACQKYHHTFVKHGHVYVGHKNSDPMLKIGDIVRSAYNEPMGRIELYLFVDEKKASAQLHTLAREGTHPFSMACRVPYDRCTICNGLRKGASDPKRCDDLRHHFGEKWADGREVGTQNDEPTWFDESFVDRPADRICWDIKSAAAGSDAAMDPDTLWVPDAVESVVSPTYARKLAVFDAVVSAEAEIGTAVADRGRSAWSRSVVGICKAASAFQVPAQALDDLRRYSPGRVFAGLAAESVVLPVHAFFKFAAGPQYHEVSEIADAAALFLQQHGFSGLRKTSAYQRACRNNDFDVDTSDHVFYSGLSMGVVPADALQKLASAGALAGVDADQRIIAAAAASPGLRVKAAGVCSADSVPVGAEIYAAYAVAAVAGILDTCKEAGVKRLATLVAAQMW